MRSAPDTRIEAILASGAGDERPVWAERCAAQIRVTLSLLEVERASRTTPFWFGAAPSHADVAVACALWGRSPAQLLLLDEPGNHLDLPALAAPNVDLETERIAEITPTGVRTVDGVEHEADVIIWGTGFKATEFLEPMSIKGGGGRDLHDEWSTGAHAYYGMTVPGFPGLFIMYGPNTNTGGGSIIYFLETQAKYVADFVDRLARTGKPMEVRADVEQAYDDRVQKELSGSVWSQCVSWYRQSPLCCHWLHWGTMFSASSGPPISSAMTWPPLNDEPHSAMRSGSTPSRPRANAIAAS